MNYELSYVFIMYLMTTCWIVSKIAPKEQFELFLPFVLIPFFIWWIKKYKSNIFEEFEDNTNFFILAVLALFCLAFPFLFPWLLVQLLKNKIILILFLIVGLFIAIKQISNYLNKKN